ncbi:MAG: type II secretion system protein GspG [Kiritimatiellae bacterium]|nr:type II secretion system protein GspG [Kiritimatiellia bacterium]
MDAFGWRENGAVNLAVGLLYALLVLAAVAIPNYMRYLDDPRVSTTRELIKNVETATQMYSMKHGIYPDSLDTLTQETEDEEALLEGSYVDPWGTELRYERRGKRRPRITSAGPDGEFDTSDDITNYDGKP